MATPRKNQQIFINNNQQKLSVPVRNALRSMRRQDNKQTVLVRGPNDPRPIRKDILVTKTVEVGPIPASSTYASIYALLDAGATPFFTEMRAIGVSLYGVTSDGAITCTIPSDGASFVDRGVGTAKRPALHIRFPEVVRIAWVSTTSPTVLVTLPGAGVAGTVAQYTIEVRGDASSDS
jgi:hypothetical protein